MLYIAQPLEFSHLDQARMYARSNDCFATLTRASKVHFVEPYEAPFWSAFSKGLNRPVSADASLVVSAHGGRNTLDRMAVRQRADSRRCFASATMVLFPAFT